MMAAASLALSSLYHFGGLPLEPGTYGAFGGRSASAVFALFLEPLGLPRLRGGGASDHASEAVRLGCSDDEPASPVRSVSGGAFSIRNGGGRRDGEALGRGQGRGRGGWGGEGGL